MSFACSEGSAGDVGCDSVPESVGSPGPVGSLGSVCVPGPVVSGSVGVSGSGGVLGPVGVPGSGVPGSGVPGSGVPGSGVPGFGGGVGVWAGVTVAAWPKAPVAERVTPPERESAATKQYVQPL
ncbi:hypothetical protein [Streptomyces coeruleorubidus]|uniref:hypothetical protein n=1 Tax=Streptomyces coeruleorubidus TaxID=116188 RepID=UPI00365CF879